MNIEFRNNKTNDVLESWSFTSFVPHCEDIMLIGQSQFNVIKVVWRNQESVVCYVETF